MKGWKIALIGVILILAVIVAANLPSFSNPTNKPVYTIELTNKIRYNILTPHWTTEGFTFTRSKTFDMPAFSITSPTTQEITVACWLVRTSDSARSSTKSVSLGDFNEVLGDTKTTNFLFTGVPEGEYIVHYSVNRGLINIIDETHTITVSDATPPAPQIICGLGDVGCYIGSAIASILGPIVNILIVLGVIAILILAIILVIVWKVVK